MANSGRSFLNFTQLDEDSAREVLQRTRDIVTAAEQDRRERVASAKRNHDFWLNKIWSDRDKSFFDELDISPYEFPVQRTLINNLISRQRNRNITFDLVPTDIHSYDRHRRGREKYIQEYADRHTSPMAAAEFYDKYGDDQYARAVSTMIHNTRIETNAKYVESECFQEGIVTGLDFFKAVFSKKNNNQGGIEITRRPQRSVFYDENSVEYDLSDIEFIGETHLLYKTQLINEYPQHKEQIEEFFKEYTELDSRNFVERERSWENWYNFNPSSGSGEAQVTVAELWYLDTEERFVVRNTESGEKRLVKHGLTEDDILDKLLTKTLADLKERADTDPEAKAILMADDAKAKIASIANDRYQIETTQNPIWYKAVLTYNALFEFKRSPLPHGSHPYFPFFAQYSEGDFTSLMDDIEDVIIAINKALAIRELMMAHGSKNLVVVDEEALAGSDYDLDDIADQWTSIGGVLAIKPRAGKDINSVIQSITTVGEGLPAINMVIEDLDNRLYQISGVNLAQLGITQRETTASGFRDQLNAGQSNNGIIFDNFIRSMEDFYEKKVVPLIVWLMKNRQQKVVRSLSDEFKPWVNIDYGEEFELFEEAIYNGNYSMALTPTQDNKQIAEQRSAKYLEIAMTRPDLMPLEVALEFSTDPQRYKLIQRMKEERRNNIQEMAANQVSIQQVQQIAMETGLDPDTVTRLVEQMQKAKAKELAGGGGGQGVPQQPNAGAGKQIAQGAPTIREQANNPEKTQNQEFSGQ